MASIFCWALAVSLVSGQPTHSTEADFASAASIEDDECTYPDSDNLCAMNALQLRQAKISLPKKQISFGDDKESDLMLRPVEDFLMLGKHWSDQLHTMAQHATRNETGLFLSSLRICNGCQNYQRLGEAPDGGYLTCMDGIAGASEPKKLSAAFSLGIEAHDKWSADVSQKLQLPVFQFDCTVTSAAPCPTCSFFPKCLRSANGLGEPLGHLGQSWTFEEMLSHTGQASARNHSLLLKIDIEGAEWPFFAEEDESVLQKFDQIIVEFHQLHVEAKHPLYLKAVQKIKKAGLQVAHLHGNNYEGMYTVGDAHVPNVLEVTFIMGSHEHCSDDEQELPLDSPNNPAVAELPPAHLKMTAARST